eukprot:m51a1_g6859 hypothetical protein (494) ;mRNA; r:131876-134120
MPATLEWALAWLGALALAASAQLPEPPEQWYMHAQGVWSPKYPNITREAWQTRWRSAEALSVPAISTIVPRVRTTTWMDRSRSLAVGWQRDQSTHETKWSNTSFSWPLEVVFRRGLIWSKSKAVPCGASGMCDKYMSSPDRELQNTTYTMHYLAGTNRPVKVSFLLWLSPQLPKSLVFDVDVWLTGSDVPPLPTLDAGAPGYVPEPVCTEYSAQQACEAVLSSRLPAYARLRFRVLVGLTHSSRRVREPVRPPELPCAVHVVAETNLNGMVFVRDELWKDHDAFAWRTAFWALSSLQSTVYRYLKPYNYSAIWRDDLSSTFNSTDASTCQVTPLTPRTFWFGPVNFSTLDVVGITRNTVVEGRRVDVLHATGTTLGIESPYDLVYAAGTDTLVSFNGSFFFGAIGLTVPVVCRVHVFEQRLPISDAMFTPPQSCTGAQAVAARPPASAEFSKMCYVPHISSGSTSATIVPTASAANPLSCGIGMLSVAALAWI